MTILRPVVELIRLEENERYGTFGALKIDKQVFCCTLEPPDRENRPNISSIPVQQYLCRRYSSKRHPDTFQILNVPGRTYILFHAGNTARDTAGCPLLGSHWDKLKTDRAVLNSGATFDKFMEVMKNQQVFHLTIIELL